MSYDTKLLTTSTISVIFFLVTWSSLSLLFAPLYAHHRLVFTSQERQGAMFAPWPKGRDKYTLTLFVLSFIP